MPRPMPTAPASRGCRRRAPCGGAEHPPDRPCSPHDRTLEHLRSNPHFKSSARTDTVEPEGSPVQANWSACCCARRYCESGHSTAGRSAGSCLGAAGRGRAEQPPHSRQRRGHYRRPEPWRERMLPNRSLTAWPNANMSASPPSRPRRHTNRCIHASHHSERPFLGRPCWRPQSWRHDVASLPS